MRGTIATSGAIAEKKCSNTVHMVNNVVPLQGTVLRSQVVPGLRWRFTPGCYVLPFQGISSGRNLRANYAL